MNIARVFPRRTKATPDDWRKFQRLWVRPQIVYHKLKEGA